MAPSPTFGRLSRAVYLLAVGVLAVQRPHVPPSSFPSASPALVAAEEQTQSAPTGYDAADSNARCLARRELSSPLDLFDGARTLVNGRRLQAPFDDEYFRQEDEIDEEDDYAEEAVTYLEEIEEGEEDGAEVDEEAGQPEYDLHRRGVEDTDPVAMGGNNIMKARLYGNMFTYAYYFLDILVGTPAQRESVILDTGSSLLGFPCQGCSHCGTHIDKHFDVSSSETAEWMSCHDRKCFGQCQGSLHRCSYKQSYSEGSSISGSYLSDMVAVGNLDQHNAPVRYDYIGCHDRETNLFVTQRAAGIFGISFPKGFKQPTLLDVLFGQDAMLNSRVFALCVAENGGLFTVGGYDAAHNRADSQGNSDVKWTSIVSHSSYRVALEGMEDSEGNVIADGKQQFGETVVDSGTTYTYLPPVVYKSFSTKMDKFCTVEHQCERQEGSRPCWRAENVDELEQFLPVFKLKFGDGVQVDWHPRSYLYLRSNQYWCEAVDDNHLPSTVLGMSFFKQKQIIFDREENRVGFVDAVCPEFDAENRPKGPDAVGPAEVVSYVELSAGTAEKQANGDAPPEPPLEAKPSARAPVPAVAAVASPAVASPSAAPPTAPSSNVLSLPASSLPAPSPSASSPSAASTSAASTSAASTSAASPAVSVPAAPTVPPVSNAPLKVLPLAPASSASNSSLGAVSSDSLSGPAVVALSKVPQLDPYVIWGTAVVVIAILGLVLLLLVFQRKSAKVAASYRSVDASSLYQPGDSPTNTLRVVVSPDGPLLESASSPAHVPMDNHGVDLASRFSDLEAEHGDGDGDGDEGSEDLHSIRVISVEPIGHE
eukprot:GHVT01016197.1.p1 GENE.GHVT01016197.1~~GHVT01016197.1.p1  ORF type:complete len:822 (+),score=175.58 GHVT01016197.1:1111-3576(+)